MTTICNPGRLRQLAACLGAAAENGTFTFLSAAELSDLRDLGAIALHPAQGVPQSLSFGADLLLLERIEAGLWMADATPYLSLEVTEC